HLSLRVDRDTFEQELAPSRTFCFYEEVEQLMKAGLIKGGSLENANIVRGGSVLTEGGLRFRDEFVRHKILDVVGDVYLLGRPLAAHIVAIRPGHTVNFELTKQLARALSGRPSQPPVGSPTSVAGMTEVSSETLIKLLPHRYPFLLVDRVVKLEEKRIAAIKNVTFNEPFFPGHFPGRPVMPGVLQVEAMAQTAGVLMLKIEGNAGKLAYFMSANNVKFRKPVIPGDQLLIEAELTQSRRNIGRAQCTCKVGDAVVSEAELTFLIEG
ncbi:MAG: 3-hydroxyacyl-ACP dehydratase FabZ, partial [Verrucomicrobia bacterium]|nr:3-hydroxyacyl-ACP dehydratase FabZ [Verrucomicrobiota bacterium]